MSVLNGIAVPHPPLIVPNVGRGEEKKIENITSAMEEAAQKIVEAKPDTVVIISPHAPSYYDYIQLSKGAYGEGDLAQFNDPYDRFRIPYDQELVDAIESICMENGIPAGTLGKQDGSLDHGTMVPLYFLKSLAPETKFVRIGLGGPNNKVHYQVGQAIQEAAQKLGRKVSIVASGDLSHCQKAGTHYGYRPEGPKYDEKIMEILGDGDFLRLLEVSEEDAEKAMVCGQKSFCVLAGALDGLSVDAKALAHSAEFGVGYGVATFTDPKEDLDRHFLIMAEAQDRNAYEERIKKEDAYVKLARDTINDLIHENELVIPSASLPSEMLEDRAGVFVSIHKNGELRGCIGTTEPTEANVATEIVRNAIAASTRDPRFPAIQPWELEELEINVDVLGKPEIIEDESQLDVKKYGVIVSKNGKRGLLLPDLEGVDTITKQVSIAKQKAGLLADEPGCTLERFEVVRHV
ncbi:AmmeMemoRadiSam system protein A [Dubosiella newyorkensis]|uniref:AmmeMemoRadiSam system protein A n=1 Tax=Dubosiella newyorkensis TaxID=1862672 RepID=UPI0023EFB805|nr:AmmeMemoRadiSam system protein A [Dubosiella newyorkensis]